MGSLGDKFKKLAGDQTRQLLQNFQNAQSSKTRNGYSYGKLNEDGTATLADGTVVQTVVKGRPGQYAPVFNLGNGQGLVDQPEAKFFNIDSSGIFSIWQLIVVPKQILPMDTPNSDFFFFNTISVGRVGLRDALNDVEYNLDPELLELIPDYPTPTFEFLRGGEPGIDNGRLRAESLQEYSLVGSQPSVPQTSLFISNPTVFSAPVREFDFIYGSILAEFSVEGKDIILYRVSSQKINCFYATTGPSNALLQDWQTGDNCIDYAILKDFYVEDGLVKSDSVNTGKYYLPVTSPVYYRITDGFSDVIFTYDGAFTRDFRILLSRDEDNEPSLSISYEMAQINAFIDSGTYYESSIRFFANIRNVNTSPVVVWSDIVDLYKRFQEGNFNFLVYRLIRVFNNQFYGILGFYDNGNLPISTVNTYYTIDPYTGGPVELLRTVVNGDVNGEVGATLLVTPDEEVYFPDYTNQQIALAGYPEPTNTRFFSLTNYLNSGSFDDTQVLGSIVNGSDNGPCPLYTDRSWTLIYAPEGVSGSTIGKILRVTEKESGLEVTTIREEFDFYSFLLYQSLGFGPRYTPTVFLNIKGVEYSVRYSGSNCCIFQRG